MVLSIFGLNALSLSLKLGMTTERKSDERPKPQIYYLGYENDSDFFLGDRRLFVVFLYDSSSKVVSRTHIARALLSHLSERV